VTVTENTLSRGRLGGSGRRFPHTISKKRLSAAYRDVECELRNLRTSVIYKVRWFP
jgi:hypothetical protein